MEKQLNTNPIDAHDHISAILEKGAQFNGKLTFEGTVRLGGKFEGEIFTNDTLIIGESGEVNAQVEADTVILNGKFEGNLFAKSKVIMNPPAYFKGTVTTPSLKIEEGVVFEGASYMPKT
jgi:cytoskeletal protein CcmA (bactofilin family)